MTSRIRRSLSKIRGASFKKVEAPGSASGSGAFGASYLNHEAEEGQAENPPKRSRKGGCCPLSPNWNPSSGVGSSVPKPPPKPPPRPTAPNPKMIGANVRSAMTAGRVASPTAQKATGKLDPIPHRDRPVPQSVPTRSLPRATIHNTQPLSEEELNVVKRLGIVDLPGEEGVLALLAWAVRGTPLPAPWTEEVDPKGRFYFAHLGRELTRWEHPLTNVLRECSEVVRICFKLGVSQRVPVIKQRREAWEQIHKEKIQQWVKTQNTDGRTYYANICSREVMWEHPTDKFLPALYLQTKVLDVLLDADESSNYLALNTADMTEDRPILPDIEVSLIDIEHHQVGKFIVDNSTWKAKTSLIRHRESRMLMDFHPTATTNWGEMIEGYDLGDGWLMTTERTFIPFMIDGCPVVFPEQEPERNTKLRAVFNQCDIQRNARLDKHALAKACQNDPDVASFLGLPVNKTFDEYEFLEIIDAFVDCIESRSDKVTFQEFKEFYFNKREEALQKAYPEQDPIVAQKINTVKARFAKAADRQFAEMRERLEQEFRKTTEAALEMARAEVQAQARLANEEAEKRVLVVQQALDEERDKLEFAQAQISATLAERNAVRQKIGEDNQQQIEQVISTPQIVAADTEGPEDGDANGIPVDDPGEFKVEKEAEKEAAVAARKPEAADVKADLSEEPIPCQAKDDVTGTLLEMSQDEAVDVAVAEALPEEIRKTEGATAEYIAAEAEVEVTAVVAKPEAEVFPTVPSAPEPAIDEVAETEVAEADAKREAEIGQSFPSAPKTATDEVAVAEVAVAEAELTPSAPPLPEPAKDDTKVVATIAAKLEAEVTPSVPASPEPPKNEVAEADVEVAVVDANPETETPSVPKAPVDEVAEEEVEVTVAIAKPEAEIIPSAPSAPETAVAEAEVEVPVVEAKPEAEMTPSSPFATELAKYEATAPPTNERKASVKLELGDLKKKERKSKFKAAVQAQLSNVQVTTPRKRPTFVKLVEVAKTVDNENRPKRVECLVALQAQSADNAKKTAIWLDEDGAKAFLLECASLTNQKDKKIRCSALAVLWNLAIEPANRVPMWNGPGGARDALVRAMQAQGSGSLQIRACAIAALQHLSEEPQNRASMWADNDARKEILKAAVPPDGEASSKQETRDLLERALSTLWNLSAEETSGPCMWNEPEVKTTLVRASKCSHPQDKKARLRALAALHNLCAADQNKVSMWQDVCGVRFVLLEAASLTEQTYKKLRTYALAALQNLSTHVAAEMWSMDSGARSVILEAARSTDRKARSTAVGVLQNLTMEPENRLEMWRDVSGACKAIMEAVVCQEPADKEVREMGLVSLLNICGQAVVKEEIWADDVTRAAIIAAANVDNKEMKRIKLCGLRLLQELALAPQKQQSFWAEEGARKAVVDAVLCYDPKPRAARECAVRILFGLAVEASVKADMWQDENGARAALLAAASRAGSEPLDRKVQACAIGALQHLSSEPQNKLPMWNDRDGTRAVLISAAKLQDPSDIMAKTCALGALQNMSNITSGDTNMWEDDDAKYVILEAANLRCEMYKRARDRALGAIRNLTATSKNKGPMWRDDPVARSAIVEAARLSGPSDREARECAFASLWNLASDPENARLMQEDTEGVVSVVEAAKALTASDDIKVRAYALAAEKKFPAMGVA